MARKRLHIMNTSFRDGFQSVYGARVFTKDFLPAVEAAKKAGIDHFETGGGARFQSLVFYCNEDPFDMMDAVRTVTGPDANLQALARGVNVVGLESQSSEMIALHAQLFKKHGMTTIRNFDALNDVDNLIYSGKCIAEAGLRHEVTVTMMELPPSCSGAHTAEHYMEVVRKILDADIPFHSLCFKDASGTSTPRKVYETIRQARALIPAETSIRFHTHETAGISVVAYRAAIDAGADGIDLAMAPVSGGSSQPDIVTMWHALRGSEYDMGIDIHAVLEAEEIFKECMQDYFTPPEARAVEPMIPYSPMPGGALTANTQMMRDNKILDKFAKVIDAMGEVVKRGGFGTSVTPVSQFYFQQAFNNVMFGPWEKIAPGYGKMVLGYFGRTPSPPDPEIIKLAHEQLELTPTERHPIELNDEDPKKSISYLKRLLANEGLPTTDECIFIAGTCKEKGIDFLKGKAKVMVKKNGHANGPVCIDDGSGLTVTLDGEPYEVVLDGSVATVNGVEYEFDIAEGVAKAKVASDGLERHTIEAPLPGVILRVSKGVGALVDKGETILILEAMKMETEIKSPHAGKVVKVATAGDQVTTGQCIAEIQ